MVFRSVEVTRSLAFEEKNLEEVPDLFTGDRSISMLSFVCPYTLTLRAVALSSGLKVGF